MPERCLNDTVAHEKPSSLSPYITVSHLPCQRRTSEAFSLFHFFLRVRLPYASRGRPTPCTSRTEEPHEPGRAWHGSTRHAVRLACLSDRADTSLALSAAGTDDRPDDGPEPGRPSQAGGRGNDRTRYGLYHLPLLRPDKEIGPDS